MIWHSARNANKEEHPSFSEQRNAVSCRISLAVWRPMVQLLRLAVNACELTESASRATELEEARRRFAVLSTCCDEAP
jgi:hypothetical protein